MGGYYDDWELESRARDAERFAMAAARNTADMRAQLDEERRARADMEKRHKRDMDRLRRQVRDERKRRVNAEYSNWVATEEGRRYARAKRRLDQVCDELGRVCKIYTRDKNRVKTTASRAAEASLDHEVAAARRRARPVKAGAVLAIVLFIWLTLVCIDRKFFQGYISNWYYAYIPACLLLAFISLVVYAVAAERVTAAEKKRREAGLQAAVEEERRLHPFEDWSEPGIDTAFDMRKRCERLVDEGRFLDALEAIRPFMDSPQTIEWRTYPDALESMPTLKAEFERMRAERERKAMEEPVAPAEEPEF